MESIFTVALREGSNLTLTFSEAGARLTTVDKKCIVADFRYFAFCQPNYQSGRLWGIEMAMISRASSNRLPFSGCLLMDTLNGDVIGPFLTIEQIMPLPERRGI